MGAKTWMLVLADSNARVALAAKPQLDRDASAALAQKLFPQEKLEPMGDGDLSFTCPVRDELLVGSFPGVTVVAAHEFALDRPSELPQRFIAAGAGGVVTLHAMHNAVDWFAFAIWNHGKLERSLSVSPDDGVMEDIGAHLAFEEPYWAGAHRVVDDEGQGSYPLPFHPLELGEEALKVRFGYQLEGFADPSLLEPESVALMRYRRARARWWKFW